MKAERRIAARKDVDFISVSDITSLANYTVIAKSGYIVDASTSGFLVVVTRKDLVPKDLKQNLSLESIVGQTVVMYLPQMNLDLDGTITRARHIGKGHFEIGLDFSIETPEYWKECLIDLLPSPGEFDDEDEE